MSASVRHRVDENDVRATIELTGDSNPIHHDPQVARRLGQSRPIVHGVFLLGLISRLIGTELPGPGSIWFASEIDFHSPVYSGDEVEAVIFIERVSRANHIVVLGVKILRVPDQIVATGTVKVKLPVSISVRGNDMGLDSMTALVTGGTRGIGEAITRKLAANGVGVVASFKEDGANAERVVSEIRAVGGTAHAIRADMTRPDEVQSLFSGAVDQLGKVDIVVNNATPPIRAKPLVETAADDFQVFFNAYVLGSFQLVQLALPGMRERKFGRVINVLTSALSEVPPKMGAYITAKSALYGLSRAMAVEFGPWGINVNMVSPSTIISRRSDELGVGAQELIARKTPLRRLGEPEEVADVVLFLVGRSSSYISGANIPVTGGILGG
jgi:3-oxoacyl-[acyl-carrier protein] reductase